MIKSEKPWTTALYGSKTFEYVLVDTLLVITFTVNKIKYLQSLCVGRPNFHGQSLVNNFLARSRSSTEGAPVYLIPGMLHSPFRLGGKKLDRIVIHSI